MKLDTMVIELLRHYKAGRYSESDVIAILERELDTAEAIGHGKGVVETLTEQLERMKNS